MKLLCVADTVAPLVYSTQVKERFKDIEIVIGAGDLPMEYLGFIASSLNKPVLFVFGNHNLKKLDLFKRRRGGGSDLIVSDSQPQNYYGSTHIDNKVLRTKGLLIGGLGGSIRYNKGENQFSERQMFFKILSMIPRMLFNRLFYGRFIDILVTHAAPRGIHDKEDPCHIGFKVFLWFMRAFKPRYLLHGHIHLYDQNAVRETDYFQTRVINVYDYYVLNT